MMSAIIDGVIILLLIGSISYGYLVSRKVRRLMATLKELEPLVEQFSYAVDKSQNSVAQMRQSIAAAEQPGYAEPEPAYHGSAQRSAFAPQPKEPAPQPAAGMRVVRDKQDLVRAFFDTSDTARA